MDITDRQQVERALAATYPHGERRLDDYRSVLTAASTEGQTMKDVAEARGFSIGTAYDWNQGRRAPEPVNAIQAANEKGWLDLEWTETPFTGLNVLVAWIFAGGSINQLHEPSWTVRQRELTPLETAFYEAKITVKRVHTRSGKRASEYRPAEDGALTGRMLAALGAPTGEKAKQQITLPPYLDEAPFMVRLDFARAYVYHRGTLRGDKPTSPVQLREEREIGYMEELRTFFRDVVGNPDWIRRSGDDMLLLRRRAAAMLCADPLFGEWL